MSKFDAFYRRSAKIGEFVNLLKRFDRRRRKFCA